MSTLNRYAIWLVQPDNYSHSQAFEEAAQTLSAGFVALGGECPIYRMSRWSNQIIKTPIVLGAHLLAREQLPDDAIIYNTEQAGIETYAWTSPAYDEALQRHRVLDYSVHNARALRQRGCNVQILPLRGQPETASIVQRPEAEKDIDVLFYGSLNHRRREIIAQCTARGLTVKSLFNVYAAERDAAIARSKIVANVHYYDPAIFEVFRVSHLLTNGSCVVSEGDPDDDLDCADFQYALMFSPYDEFADNCKALVDSVSLREYLTIRARQVIAANTQADEIRRLIDNNTWSL